MKQLIAFQYVVSSIKNMKNIHSLLTNYIGYIFYANGIKQLVTE